MLPLLMFEHESTELTSNPAVRPHQQHAFLLLSTLAEREKPRVWRSPSRRSHGQRTCQFRPYDHQEAVGTLTDRHHALEKQLVVSHPHGRFRAFEYTIDHPRGEVWIEPAKGIESCIATNLRPLAHVAIYDNARSVVVDRPSKTVSIV